MLHIDSSSSQGTKGSEDSVRVIQRPSVSLRKVSLTIDENDPTIAENCQNVEGGEVDDVFPLDLSESLTSFHFPESSTIGRELVASTSILDLSQLETKKSVTLRRQLPLERSAPRAARSTIFHHNNNQVTSERTKSEDISNFKPVEMVKSFQSRGKDIKKRRDAMKRRSTRDFNHRTCLIKMCSTASIKDIGWSEVVECSSMLKIFAVKRMKLHSEIHCRLYNCW